MLERGSSHHNATYGRRDTQSSQKEKSKLPTHIELYSESCGLSRDSIVLLEQIRTIDKRRLKEKMGKLDDVSMNQIDHALSISFGLEQGGQQRTT